MSSTKSPYTIILTHDVDHLSLRSYPLFSRMTGSFLKRCLWNNLLRMIRRDISFRQYLDSTMWFILYPFIKIGIVTDPWEKAVIDIMTLEKKYGVCSTFFFIPFQNEPGQIEAGLEAPKSRAAKYNLKRYVNLLRRMESEGWEVGVHGIDAHISIEHAERELNVIRELLPEKKEVGIRMHWLYQTDDLWKNLKLTGYCYDASYGSNSVVGFMDGRYLPFKKDNLWVIPLHVQDCSLLGHWHMNLSLRDAWFEVERVMDEAKKKSGVITVLWHTNSFGVHHYWETLYERILRKAKADDGRIMKCLDICREMENNPAQGYMSSH